MSPISWTRGLQVLFLACAMVSFLIVPVKATDLMAVKDVKPGMEGYAKTVIQGDEISTFKVKILGIMKDKGPSGDLILAQFSGPVIDESGGIAHGMSGSPVYIDGKLVGAVAYGWGFTRSKIGMITPIEDMIRLWNIPYAKDVPNPWAEDGKLVPLGTPLMAYGFDSKALAYMQKTLPDYQFQAYDTAASPDAETPKPLVEGGSVAATLVDGDLRLGAIGTVTYVDHDRIVAFGHPFLKVGRTSYFMHNAYILAVVNSIESSFKLGAIGAPVGAITEDRGAGIGGVVGLLPSFIPLRVDILNTDTGIAKRSNVKVIDDESLTPSLVATSVYSFMSKAMNRTGGGTATISYVITPRDKKFKPFVRTNMVYSPQSINEKSIDELYNVVKRLLQNRFTNYEVSDIAVNLDVTEERKTAQFLSATASTVVASPGDTITVRATVLPYRGKEEVKEILFRVPDDQPLGDVILEVRGGGETPLPYLIEKQKLNLTPEILSRLHVYKTFDEYFHALAVTDQNNQIVVELLQTNTSAIDDSDSVSDSKAELSKVDLMPSPGKEKIDTKKGADDEAARINEDKKIARINVDYIVEGDGQFTIHVVSPSKKDEAIKKLLREKAKAAKDAADSGSKDKGKVDLVSGLKKTDEDSQKKNEAGPAKEDKK